jgi:hypothetical protein
MPEEHAFLARADGMGLREWLLKLDAAAAVLGRSGGYREGGVPPDELLRVLGDANASSSARAAAARVLAKCGESGLRVRVAEAVNALPADLRVRVESMMTPMSNRLRQRLRHSRARA